MSRLKEYKGTKSTFVRRIEILNLSIELRKATFMVQIIVGISENMLNFIRRSISPPGFIHELDKKEIYNYAITIFCILTDIKEQNNLETMKKALQIAFSFIEGYTKDLQTQVRFFTLLYNVFKQNYRCRFEVFSR
ncbi:unnamed protein product [Moneuplotes crassus]|uniref:Uncharacterized protein n=1 Tax=Euplotes crassus TaxID=5936 RepID=A0AAD1Y8I1_EUPCR|nr:unnamed protein product [Moneuplotes crassus]